MTAWQTRHRRRAVMFGVMAALSAAVVLVLEAFGSNQVPFFTPSQVAQHEAPVGQHFRLAGVVEEGSVHRLGDGVGVRFMVTDTAQRIAVVYPGLLPDLFQEGRGVVAQGQLDAAGLFVAHEVNADHDDHNTRPEAALALGKSGVRP
ncbi:cytochrome c maturation protein CcmE [Ideonella sp. A 288]|uniref:cytochrome c maturation protein CcmE n=1 Tax=Ideonella sp. A 288 TaxID=1962181 RepID=UPI002100906B|nr:cytochrome c maturation protein CcmE [Ideonella sp. A 288]